MSAQTIDRRSSTPASPCKNCGLDVGLYPSMHRCQQQRNLYLSPLPPLPTRRHSGANNPLQVPRNPIHSPDSLSTSGSSLQLISNSSSSSSFFSSPSLSDTTSPSPSSGKWSRFTQKSDQQQYPPGGGDSIYLNNFNANLPEHEKKGKRLWGKVRSSQKWEQWTQQGDIPKQGGKLWGKLRLAAQNMADKIPSHDDNGPESDESDWEGETHVSRILREYYVKKRRSLPHWLRDEDTTNTASIYQQRYSNGSNFMGSPPPAKTKAPSRRRLWDGSDRRQDDHQEQQHQLNRGINFDHAQKQSGHQSNNSDTFHHHYNTPTQQCNQYRYDDNDDDIQRRRRDNHYQLERNDQQHRRQSYQTSPPSSYGKDQDRRFSMGYASPASRQQQYWDKDGRIPATFHQDRLHGPRTQPTKHNQH